MKESEAFREKMLSHAHTVLEVAESRYLSRYGLELPLSGSNMETPQQEAEDTTVSAGYNLNRETLQQRSQSGDTFAERYCRLEPGSEIQNPQDISMPTWDYCVRDLSRPQRESLGELLPTSVPGPEISGLSDLWLEGPTSMQFLSNTRNPVEHPGIGQTDLITTYCANTSYDLDEVRWPVDDNVMALNTLSSEHPEGSTDHDASHRGRGTSFISSEPALVAESARP